MKFSIKKEENGCVLNDYCNGSISVACGDGFLHENGGVLVGFAILIEG